MKKEKCGNCGEIMSQVFNYNDWRVCDKCFIGVNKISEKLEVKENFTVYIPILTTQAVEVQAIDVMDALEQVYEMHDNMEIDFPDGEPDDQSTWWVEGSD